MVPPWPWTYSSDSLQPSFFACPFFPKRPQATPQRGWILSGVMRIAELGGLEKVKKNMWNDMRTITHKSLMTIMFW